MASLIETKGFVVHDEFLDREVCQSLLGAIDRYRSTVELHEIHREARGRALRYSVIDGHQIRDQLPEVWDLYAGPVRDLVSEIATEEMFPLDNVRAGVNVNVMPPGRSEYRWHYDRTPLTAVLYLNEVEGGETELYPGLRILLSERRPARAQRLLDRFVSVRPVRSMRAGRSVVSPKPGRLVTMAGNRCWHSVRGVEGRRDRVNVILAYDRKGVTSAVDDNLDSYLYSNDHTAQKDPNYLR